MLAHYGISPGPLNAGPTLEPTLDDLADLGCKSVRSAEPLQRFDPHADGTYDPRALLRISLELSKRDMTLVSGLLHGGGNTYDETARCARAFGELCSVLDDLPNIECAQTENEPEHVKADKKPTPGRWVPYQQQCYEAGKNRAPNVVVATGGLGGMEADYGNLMSPPQKLTCVDFLADSYKLGVGGYFDLLGFHIYCAPYTIEQSIIEGRKGGYLAVEARKLMVANGDKAKQIIISEHAVPSSGWDSDNVYTEAGQAKWLLDAHAWLDRKKWIRSAYWFTDRNHPEADPTDSGDWEGLLHADGTRKPAANAYQSVAE